MSEEAVWPVFIAGALCGGSAATLMWLWHLTNADRCPTCDKRRTP